MTVDVNIHTADDAFLDDIDEIIEDTMVQMFFLQPEDADALHKAQEDAAEYSAIFYAAPLSLRSECDENCIGYRIDDTALLDNLEPLDKPLFIDESLLDETTVDTLIERGGHGIILNATKPHDTLKNYYIAIGPGSVDTFGPELLSQVDMNKIVLQSGYPEHGFDTIFGAVKQISDALFRPEQSIIARATQHSLALCGFKK